MIFFCITETDQNIFTDVWPLTGTCTHYLRTLDGGKAKSLKNICTFLKSTTELPFTSYFWKTSGVAVTPNSWSGMSIATSLNTWAASLSKLCRTGWKHGVIPWTSTHRWLHDLMLALDRRTDLEESHYSDVMGVYELSCRVCRLQGFSTGASATLHPLDYPYRRPLTCRDKVDIKRLFQVLWSNESPTSACSSALSRNDNKRVETGSQWIQLSKSQKGNAYL